MLNLLEDTIDAPLGPLQVICDEQFRLRIVEQDQRSDRMERLFDIHYRTEGYQRITTSSPGGLDDRLSEYFTGNLNIIDSLETVIAGTPLQREVWQALHTIPCGQVMHYDQLAEQLGHPDAVRAVGTANGPSSISIVAPCHRTIGRNGIMTGYVDDI